MHHAEKPNIFMAKQKYTILIVDDDPAVQAACSALSENYEQVVFFNEPDYAKAFANVEKTASRPRVIGRTWAIKCALMRLICCMTVD